MRRGASFACFRTIPIDYLKIDGSFMRRLKENGVDRATVESQRAAFDGFDKNRNGWRGARAPRRWRRGGWLTGF